MERRPDIDGLRAVAIIPVVLFHATIPGFSGGFVGVDVFFVISGFLITGIISKELSSTGSFDFWNFYARRARRLLPAAILVIVVSAAAAALILIPMRENELMKSALTALFYVSNIFYWFRVTEYFSPISGSDIYLHTWSLSVEEQFYFFWPALLFFAVRGRASLGVLMGGIFLVSFVACAVLSYRNQPMTFFLAPFRAWEFAAGALAGLVTIRRRAFELSVVGMALIAATVVMLSDGSVYPGYLVGIPVLGAALLLMSGAADHPVSRLLRSGPARTIGLYSYSWYLWHWPVLILGQELLGTAPAIRVFLAALSLGLAALTFKLVEHPIRTCHYLVVRPFLSLSAIGGVSAVAAAGLIALLVQARADMFSPRFRQYTFASMDSTELPGCMTGFGDNRVRVCSVGKGDKTVALLGDSHAEMLRPVLEGYRVITFLKSGCPAADVVAVNRRFKRVENECAEWRQAAMQKLRQMKPDLIVVTSAQGQATRDPAAWRVGYRRTLSQLAPTPTVLIHATPRFPFWVPECLAGGAECTASRSEALDARVAAAEKAAAVGMPHVHLVDFTDALCDAEKCHSIRDGLVIYRDTNHITKSYARTLVSRFRQGAAGASAPPHPASTNPRRLTSSTAPTAPR